ncbi:MAG: phosphatase [Candidatus Subteraquimicrobiales bacterium]|nr:phosphatase [Candidatus Subteraquimicrobiales bacterium]
MRIIADLHVHTVASGHAYSTVDEVAREARNKSVEFIAITDHGPALPGGAHLYHFSNLRILPRELYGVVILRSAEANIISEEGELDIPDEFLKDLDIVHVAFHPRCGYEGKNVEQNTKALLKALRNPYVDVFAHPGNPRYPFDVEKVITTARDFDVVFEINNSSFLDTTARAGSYDNDLTIATQVYKEGLNVVISSDAHFSQGVGDFSRALELAEKAGFTEERIINSSTERLLDFLKRRSQPQCSSGL